MATFYGRLLNQSKFKFQTVFSGKFDTQNEYNEMLDEVELNINLNIIEKLTERDIIITDNRSPLGYQIQSQELKDGGWRFDKILIQGQYIFMKLLN